MLVVVMVMTHAIFLIVVTVVSMEVMACNQISLVSRLGIQGKCVIRLYDTFQPFYFQIFVFHQVEGLDICLEVQI